MVSDVGNRTNIVQVNLDAQQGLTDQLKAVQQSESGVNLDEEAANLIRYQQFYQANAKVIRYRQDGYRHHSRSAQLISGES